jgi:hypothetical protein
MDPGGKAKIHRWGSSFVAIGNQFCHDATIASSCMNGDGVLPQELNGI